MWRCSRCGYDNPDAQDFCLRCIRFPRRKSLLAWLAVFVLAQVAFAQVQDLGRGQCVDPPRSFRDWKPYNSPKVKQLREQWEPKPPPMDPALQEYLDDPPDFEIQRPKKQEGQ